MNGVGHAIFQTACAETGLLQGDQEWNLCLRDACVDQNASQLRNLFVMLLLFCNPLHPETLWLRYRDEMSHDKVYQRQESGGTIEEAYNDALLILEAKMNENSKTLLGYPDMPFPVQPEDIPRVNPLLQGELVYDLDALAINAGLHRAMLNEDQEEAILLSVEEDQGGVFFVDKPGGAGKIFFYSFLLESIRASGNIALAVASSGIAALLLAGGRTSHSMFKIPFEIDHESFCSISANTDRAELINQARLIVWDEAPAQHRYCVEAVNRTLRDLLRRDQPFEGKVVVFGGNFHQCPPVVQRASRPVIAGASLRRSHLWH